MSPGDRLSGRSGRGHPAGVEKVGLKAPQVCASGKRRAETPLPREDALIGGGFLEGQKAGGGGKAEGV